MKTVALAVATLLLMASCGQIHMPQHNHQGVLVSDTAGYVRPIYLCQEENGGKRYNVGQVAFVTYNHFGRSSDTLHTYTVVDTSHAAFVASERRCHGAGVLEAVKDEVGY